MLIAAVAVGCTLLVASCGKPAKADFSLFPNQQFVPCLSPQGQTPTATVDVERGDLNDTLKLNVSGLKPGLAFDLFTVQNSPQKADGTADPNFRNFGMAWYQSDVEADDDGKAEVEIKTVLLDQIFGFDAATGLAPTATFHVGFWFNDPADAAPCGFTGFTPFNGEHHAGPLAMISRPVAPANLGPLCTSPDSSQPSGCDP